MRLDGFAGKAVLIAAITITGMLLPYNSATSKNEKMITVVFRYDDYSALSRSDIEKKMFDAFKKHGFRLTVGVVPYVCNEDIGSLKPQGNLPLTAEKIAVLKDAIKDGSVDVALHGYTHQTWRADMLGGNSEFSGVEYPLQLLRIKNGRKMLENALHQKVQIFIPPWNSYDDYTLWALEEAGFKGISSESDNSFGVVVNLEFLPGTCSLNRVREAVEAAKGSLDHNPIIVVWFHETNFLEVKKDIRGISFNDFLSLLDWIGAQKDISVFSLCQLMDSRSDLTEHRAEDYSVFYRSFILLPAWMRPADSMVYYASADEYRVEIMAWYVITFIYYGLLMFLSFVLAYGVRAAMGLRSGTLLRLLITAGAVVLVLAIIYAMRDLQVNKEGLFVITVLAGGNAGSWFFSVKNRDDKTAYGNKDR